jgi:hypothetical protein
MGVAVISPLPDFMSDVEFKEPVMAFLGLDGLFAIPPAGVPIKLTKIGPGRYRPPRSITWRAWSQFTCEFNSVLIVKDRGRCFIPLKGRRVQKIEFRRRDSFTAVFDVAKTVIEDRRELAQSGGSL